MVVAAQRRQIQALHPLTNGHSNKVTNHAHMGALLTLSSNLIQTHGKLRISPAIAAGIATTFLSFEDVLARIDAKQVAKPRGPYNKR